MNPAALLALIANLYEQLLAAQQRADLAEQRLAEQQEPNREPERQGQQGPA